MRLIAERSLLTWDSFKRYQDIAPREYVELSPGNTERVLSAHKVLCVSHRWVTPRHPDPDHVQLRELQRRLKSLSDLDAHDDYLVFYDYSSMPQHPRTADEEKGFQDGIRWLDTLFRTADKVLVLNEGYTDYKNRAWCFFEAMISHGNMYFFDDQTHVRDDLRFARSQMGNPPGVLQTVTSFDMNYKYNPRDGEIVIAAFQHLGGCRVTEPQDFALIREQLALHFNYHRTNTPFARLLVAVAKYFEMQFMMVPQDGGSPFACKPYFAESSDAVRLPSVDPHFLDKIVGWETQSWFSVPQGHWDNLKDRMFFPAIKLRHPEVEDHCQFLNKFQTADNWQEFVVEPTTLLTRRKGDDPFPTIDHVVHTLLERKDGCFVPGLPCGKEFMYVFL